MLYKDNFTEELTIFEEQFVENNKRKNNKVFIDLNLFTQYKNRMLKVQKLFEKAHDLLYSYNKNKFM